MIIGAVVQLVAALLNGFFSLIPSFTLPSWLSSGEAFPSGVADSIGGLLHAVAPFLPVSLMLSVLASIFTVWPVLIGYLVFQWVWSHTPTIAGFGTGDG